MEGTGHMEAIVGSSGKRNWSDALKGRDDAETLPEPRKTSQAG